MKKILCSLIFISCSVFSYSQNIGIGTTTPHASAALEIQDSSKGILIPRMTMSQRTAIQNPAEGLMVYQTDSTKGFWYWDGGKWRTNYNSNYIDSLINQSQFKGVRIGISTESDWQCPSNVTSIIVELWGASGGGGGGSGNLFCSPGADGGAGGKGGYIRSTIAVVPGNVYHIIIGQAGIGGQPGPWTSTSGYNNSGVLIGGSLDYTPNWGRNGIDGGDSKFSNIITAQGGSGGIGGHISNCIRFSINGQDGALVNFNYPLNSNFNSRDYIPSNFITQYPSLPNGGIGGLGQYPAYGYGGSFPTSGGNGQDGFCVISY